ASNIYRHSLLLNLLCQPPEAIFSGSLQIDGFSTGAQTAYSSMTLFIPTDDAFRAAGFPNTAALAALDSVTRTNLVSNCILYGSWFTSDFLGGRVGDNGYNFQDPPAPGVTLLPPLALVGSFSNDYGAGLP